MEVAWLRPADVLSRYFGESEERLRKAFAELQSLAARARIGANHW